MRARSPWSALNDVKKMTISPATHDIQQHISIPGSKSFTNRALIIAALASGTSTLSGLLKSDDSYWCIDALKKLGVTIDINGEDITIKGTDGQWPNLRESLYIGASGTIARFLPGALAQATKGEWEVEASQRMSERPVAELITALQQLGAKMTYTENEGYYPLQIHGKGLQGGEVDISGKISSQYLSGLLMASPYADETVDIHVVDAIVQHAYVKITLDLMKQFGVAVTYDEHLTHLTIEPQYYQGQNIQLEADASTTSYFLP